MRLSQRATVATASCLLVALAASRLVGQSPQRAPVLATPHFAFHSDFETNLNDALIAAGLARKGKKPELFHGGEESACFDKLAKSTQAAWDAAVDYYCRVISPTDFTAREQFLLRMELVGFDSRGRTPEDAEFIETARSFRAVAAPAYRACRWTAQDAKNRRWIDELKPRLAADEEAMASRIQQLYEKKWKTLPMLVDVVETVDWSGANTSWSDAGQGDVLIASEPGGIAAFEILFHESSHVLMDRGAPVRQALEDAAKSAGVKLPGDLWHVVLFYTTGEAVRRYLDEHGRPGYTPMLYEIFARGSWVKYREALEARWRPYVDGKKPLAEAARDLVTAIPKSEPR